MRDLEVVRDRLGIRRAYFDLDDTITGDTHKAFKDQMKKYANWVSRQLGFPNSYSLVTDALDKINSDVYREEFVNPKRWDTVVSRLTEELKLPTGSLKEGKPILDAIYNKELVFAPGAEETLTRLSKTDTPIYVVTHANLYWTWAKYKWLKLGRFVPPANVVIVPEDRAKGQVDYGPSGVGRHEPYMNMRYAYSGNETMVVGDNLVGDIWSAYANGVRYLFHVFPQWEDFGNGLEVPGAYHIKSLTDLFPKLYELAGTEC